MVITMGIFSGGYMKPGKGVDKNEPKKKGFFLFFDILIHKFSKLIGANSLLALLSLIWLVILYFFGGIVIANTNIVQNASEQLIAAGADPADVQGTVMIMAQLIFTVSVFTLWGSGPASAAYAYVNRCFTRGEPVWVASDGWDKLKENFLQGMIVVVIDAVILVFGLNAIYFYHTLYRSTGSLLWMTLTYVAVLVMFLYTMIHPYLYQIMVTFKCKTGALYKHAALIMIAKLPVNFFITAAQMAVIYLLFAFTNPIFATLALLILGPCLTRYPSEFYAARVIERLILKDMEKKQPEVEYIEENE